MGIFLKKFTEKFNGVDCSSIKGYSFEFTVAYREDITLQQQNKDPEHL